MTSGGGARGERLARAGVTDREAEVLALVAQRLRNGQIAERLHLSVRTVESHIASLLRKLDVSDRDGLEQIGADLRRTTRGESLPVPLTSLVGRDRETSDVMELLDRHRLITLVGPGGVGKTRLGLAIAAAAADRFPDGVHLADLAPISADLVGDTLARALGATPQPGWPLLDILRDVAGKLDGLLLIDNCEHVVDQVAEIVAGLLTAGGGLRVLATSREPMGVPGEATYEVAPLPAPDAVRLFVERAGAVSPGFELSEAVAPAVAALCERLDGLPLAIELAASRARTFGPVELVDHLDQRFELLAGGARTVAPRQRTLRAAIDWSYQLLDDEERALFDRLGVFPADFDFDGARAIAADGAAVLTVLPRLVDKSLVSTVDQSTRRYRLLESIRAYAADRLSTSDIGASTRADHAGYYFDLAESGGAGLRTGEQRSWLSRLAAEQPNLRAGLAYTVETGDRERAWRWIAALRRFWDITGQRGEARAWIDRVMALGDPPATSGVVAGLSAATSIVQPGDSQAAFDFADRAAARATGLDRISRGLATQAIGLGAIWVRPELAPTALHEALELFGDDDPWESGLTLQYLVQAVDAADEALEYGRRGVALFRQVGDQICAANVLYNMAMRSIMSGVGDDEVRRWLAESRELAEAAGSEEDRAHATVGFAHLAWVRQEYEEAAALMRECLPTLRRLGDHRCTGRALYILGRRAHQERQLEDAAQLLAASAAAIVVAGQSVVLVQALEALAAVCTDQGRAQPAAVLLGAAEAVRTANSAGMRSGRPDADLVRATREALGDAAFEAAYAEGQRLTPAQAVERSTVD